MFCGDFNANIGDIIPNEDPASAGPFGGGPRTTRGSLLASFVQSEGLQICNRMFQHDLANTYLFFHPTIGMRQIDFVIGGSLLEVIDSWADSATSVGNDHQCVHAIIRPPTPVHGHVRKHKSNTGWKPQLHDGNDAATYHAKVIYSLTSTPVHPLEELESSLVSCALRFTIRYNSKTTKVQSQQWCARIVEAAPHLHRPRSTKATFIAMDAGSQ